MAAPLRIVDDADLGERVKNEAGGMDYSDVNKNDEMKPAKIKHIKKFGNVGIEY